MNEQFQNLKRLHDLICLYNLKIVAVGMLNAMIRFSYFSKCHFITWIFHHEFFHIVTHLHGWKSKFVHIRWQVLLNCISAIVFNEEYLNAANALGRVRVIDLGNPLLVLWLLQPQTLKCTKPSLFSFWRNCWTTWRDYAATACRSAWTAAASGWAEVITSISRAWYPTALETARIGTHFISIRYWISASIWSLKWM